MERLLNRLDRRFGRYAVPNFTLFLVGAQGLVFLLDMIKPGFSQTMLVLDREAILAGEVWRLLTYLFIPSSHSPIWVFFALLWLYTMGMQLEAHWGAFRYQVYWLTGMFFTTVAAFAFDVPTGNVYLLMSLFLAFATLFPDFSLMLFFILPVKVKWLAALDAGVLIYAMVFEEGTRKIFPLLAIGNYLLFFWPTLVGLLRGGVRRSQQSRAYSDFRSQMKPERPLSRRCAKCGATDADPNLEFRVCTCEKCGGKPTEYCLEHARNH